jgi:tRNA threonylcarbamoyladenosine biosynthesis protein TsaB
MNCIALETSSETLHLALQTEKNFYAETRTMGRKFSEELVPRMKILCEQADISLSELDLIVCTNGPGSFTGLRVGMAAAKGIALAAHIPLVSLSTMEIMAYPLSLVDIPVLTVLDAKKQRYYTALFQKGVRVTPDKDLQIHEIGELVTPFSEILVTGPDAQVVIQGLSDEVTKHAAPPKFYLDPLRYRNYGESMILLGKLLLNAQGPDDIGSGPTYIRKSDAEVSLEEKNAKQTPKEV